MYSLLTYENSLILPSIVKHDDVITFGVYNKHFSFLDLNKLLINYGWYCGGSQKPSYPLDWPEILGISSLRPYQ